MINVMRKHSYGVQVLAPILKKELKAIGFIFVDDTDLAQGKLKPSNDDIDLVSNKMQIFIDNWEESLKATDRAL